jgi:hypothetical protein
VKVSSNRILDFAENSEVMLARFYWNVLDWDVAWTADSRRPSCLLFRQRFGGILRKRLSTLAWTSLQPVGQGSGEGQLD